MPDEANCLLYKKHSEESLNFYNFAIIFGKHILNIKILLNFGQARHGHFYKNVYTPN